METTISDWHGALIALAAHVDAIDLRGLESKAPSALAVELAPIVSDVLRDAIRIVSDLIRTCQRLPRGTTAFVGTYPPRPQLEFESALDAAVDSSTPWSAATLEDIAFLTDLELRRHRKQIEFLLSCGEYVAVVGECDRALRRVRKALSAIDRGVERLGLGEGHLDYMSELEIALVVRGAYARLRERLREIERPEGDRLYVQLRAAGTLLATLVAWERYSELRIRDRLQIRDLQRRLLDWFGSARDRDEGHRLWDDVERLARRFSDVNRREELRVHDGQLVIEALAAIEDGEQVVPAATMRMLERLEGRDEQIDGLLDRSDDHDDAASWRGPLLRLHRELFPGRVIH